MHAAVGVGESTRGRDAAGSSCDSGAVEHGRIIETDGARHAVAELGGVLDVVHAGDGVMTADRNEELLPG